MASSVASLETAASHAEMARPNEEAVIGALILDPALVLDAVVDVLQPNDFYTEALRDIYHTALYLWGKGAAPDLVTITNELRDRGLLDRVGGPAFLSSLVDSFPDVANSRYYADKVKKAALRRRFTECSRRIAMGDDNEGDRQRASDILAEMMDGEGSASESSLLDALWHPVGIEAVTSTPPSRRWLCRHPDGDGLLPRGRAGMLSGEGGCGKTHALLALAVAVATGREWFGHFEIDQNAAGGRSLLLLGEEEPEEIHRRLWRIAVSLNLSENERRAVADLIVAIPLAGIQFQLTETAGGRLVETDHAGELRKRLDSEEWAFIGIDPQSRFAGGDIESNNEMATRFAQIVESLCHGPGSPSVLVASHSSKMSRRAGGADVRGVTALTDAARWVATLTAKGGDVHFQQVKSNYSMPMIDPIVLRWTNGVLSAMTAVDKALAEQQEADERNRQIEADIKAVIDALNREGSLTSKSAIAKAAGIQAQRGRDALDFAIARGLVVRTGTARNTEYRPAGPNVCVLHSPHTPGTAGPRSEVPASMRSEINRDRLGPLGTAGPPTDSRGLLDTVQRVQQETKGALR